MFGGGGFGEGGYGAEVVRSKASRNNKRCCPECRAASEFPLQAERRNLERIPSLPYRRHCHDVEHKTGLRDSCGR